jgi:hypothetical protein
MTSGCPESLLSFLAIHPLQHSRSASRQCGGKHAATGYPCPGNLSSRGGRYGFGFRSQADGSLGYDLHLSLDGELCLEICLAMLEVDARQERLDMINGF